VLKTLLVPIHTAICSSQCSETSTQYAFDLSRLLGSRVILFHVLEPNETPEQARAVLDSLARKSRFTPQKIVQIPQNPSLSSEILQRVALEQADLIVLGIPDQPAFNPIISEIISHSRVPVQLIPQSTRATPIRYLEQLGQHLEPKP
jgi:hypothetical protein